ncbi:unnamed protein product [Blepharisma stoltei]|uniref:Uncharacterized protein n=1 Tax=Blepharisma stoltei TaxID=1481888 RepID=A0AAU9J1Q4_9CILI|nr:unnamed protein product [Blepharisma stoltei]
MLARRSLWRAFTSPAAASAAEELDTKIAKVLHKVAPSEQTEPQIERQKTLDERLAELDSSVAKIEALREAGKPEEIRIRNLPNKYGRAGRFPAYPWYGQAVPSEDKYPHLAERLGNYRKHIETGNDQLLKWAQVETDLNNPNFKSHFVQEPQREPDPDVNFEKGDILYENKDAGQGAALTRQIGWSSFFYIGFNMWHGIWSGRFIYPVGNEFMDIRSDHLNVNQNFLQQTVLFDSPWQSTGSIAVTAFVVPLIPLMALGYTYLFHALADGVVTKMQFNAEKDILFISQRKGAFFSQEIEVAHEVTHLQVLPPTPGTGLDNVNDRTWVTLTDMSTMENFRLCLDKKYWHPKLIQDFKLHIHSLWD